MTTRLRQKKLCLGPIVKSKVHPTVILILAFDSQVRQAKADKYETRCAGDYFKNWTQKQFLGFSNQQDNESTPMIPDKFKIDAFLILIDISKERLEKQPIQDQLGKFFLFQQFHFRWLNIMEFDTAFLIPITLFFNRLN